MARGAPPAGDQQLRPGGRFHVLEVRDLGVLGVGAEAVLLVVAGAEDIVARALHGKHGEHAPQPELERVEGEIARLDRVGEGHPDEVTEGQHEAEAVGGNVDGG